MRSRPQGRRRSVDRGTCGPGIQPRKLTSGCRRCKEKRKAPSGASISREAPGPRAVRDPVHVRKHLAREPGDPESARGKWRRGTRREVQGHTPTMNGHGKSDRPKVPMKSPNKAGRPAAEASQHRPRPCPSRTSVPYPQVPFPAAAGDEAGTSPASASILLTAWRNNPGRDLQVSKVLEQGGLSCHGGSHYLSPRRPSR
jgi:hypothetical protein